MRNDLRGFTLIELLVALALLAAFAVVATRLFGTSLHAIEQSGRLHDAATRFDSMRRTIRDDVWQAKHVELLDERTLILHDTNDRSIRWTIADDGTVTRTSESQAEIARWPELGKNARFAGGEKSLLLTIGGAELCLRNLMELANR